MQFLKALFWFLLLGLATAFAVTNWQPVEIHLWSGLVADVILPFLLLVAFLLGLVPMLILFHTVRWRLRNRIAILERTVQDLRPAPVPPPPVDLAPDPVAPPSAPPLVTP